MAKDEHDDTERAIGRELEDLRFLKVKFEHLFREVEMATQATLDALNAATAQLNASKDASIAATEALINAAGGDDAAIQAATDSIVSASAALDAETAKVTGTPQA